MNNIYDDEKKKRYYDGGLVSLWDNKNVLLQNKICVLQTICELFSILQHFSLELDIDGHTI